MKTQRSYVRLAASLLLVPMLGCEPEPRVDSAPDGALLISGSSGVMLISADHKTVRKIADQGYLGRFSPDGQKFCYGVRRTEPKEDTPRILVITDRAGTSKREVTLEKTFTVQPIWQADGKSIWVPQEDEQDSKVVRIDAETGKVIDVKNILK